MTCRCGKEGTATLRCDRGDGTARQIIPHTDPITGVECAHSRALVDPYTRTWL